jgi:hypothetical protein
MFNIIKKAAGFLGGGGVANIAGSVMSGIFNKNAASSANQYSTKMMQNKHQWQAEDLEKAGLNRILSMSDGAPMGSAAQASMQNPQLGSTINQQQQIRNQNRLLQQQTNLTAHQASSAKATAAVDQAKEKWIKDHPDEFNAFMNGQMGIGVNLATGKAAAEKDQLMDAIKGMPEKAEHLRSNWNKAVDKLKKSSKWNKYFPKK